MRDIKFRAWNKVYKQMSDVFQIQYDEGKINSVLLEDTDDTWYVEDIELMQYTGLIDKNDNEICEGDIVEINRHKYSIQFEIGSFMLVRCSDATDMNLQFENCWNDDVHPLSQFYWDSDCEEDILGNCEVIGNIYKNPSLLED